MENFNPSSKLKGDLIKKMQEKKAEEAYKYRNELGGTLINKKLTIFEVKNYEEMLNLCKNGQKFESDDYIYEILSTNDSGIIKTNKILKVENPPQQKQTFHPELLWNYYQEGRIKFLR